MKRFAYMIWDWSVEAMWFTLMLFLILPITIAVCVVMKLTKSDRWP